MEFHKAFKIASEIKDLLEPHCLRIEIAGSIRRRRPEVKDIEIVCIPKPYETGLFSSGIATVIINWPKVKGELPCKYTQRIHESGIKIDIFFATPINWGYILAIRTGPANYSHNVLANTWVKKGYVGIDGNLTSRGGIIPVQEEIDLYNLLGLPYVIPERRGI